MQKENQYYQEKDTSKIMYRIINENKFIQINNFGHAYSVEYRSNSLIVTRIKTECVNISKQKFLQTYNHVNKFINEKIKA